MEFFFKFVVGQKLQIGHKPNGVLKLMVSYQLLFKLFH